MGDRCQHGTVIDAVECGDCVIEECESLKVEVERLAEQVSRERRIYSDMGDLADQYLQRAEKAERENQTLKLALENEGGELR